MKTIRNVVVVIHFGLLLTPTAFPLSNSAIAQSIKTEQGDPADAQAPAAQGAKPFVLQSEYARWRESLPDNYPDVADYRRLMLRWVTGAEPFWSADPKHPELGKCRIQARYDHVCTARALPVYAALAADTDLNDDLWRRERLAGRLNAALAFLCATYDPGAPRDGSKESYLRKDGTWGKQRWPDSHRMETWVLGNMLDVLQIAPDAVSPENQQRIREIFVDIMEDERTSGRARSMKDLRHEGITWMMNLFARGAVFYPDHPSAAEWLDLAKHGYASSLSVEADLKDDTVVDGKPIRQWVARRCPVFYPDFTFTHHGLGIHPGYMAIAGHRMVSLYDLLERSETPISPIWTHHFQDMTDVLKGLALWDGQIAYPNAKDWADYIYGVVDIHFDMVGLQMMFGDREARLVEQGTFRHLEWLQLKRDRGDFGPSDAEYVFNVNDAGRLGFTYWLHQSHGCAEPADAEQLNQSRTRVFHSPYSKFVCVRDPGRFASWGWQGLQDGKTGRHKSTGLILPRGHDLGDHLAQWDDNLVPDYWTVDGHDLGDHLAQWDDNLVPDYWTVDEQGRRSDLQIGSKNNLVETFEGGFAVSERTELHLPGTNQKSNPSGSVLDHRVMVALPDGRTVIFAASGRAMRSVSRLGTMDLNWRFVQSIFSDMQRTIYYEGDQKECRFVKDLSTPWFNIDEIMSMVSIGKPARVTCEPFGKVNEQGVPVAEQDPFGTHAGQTVRLGVCSLKPHNYESGQEIFSVCLAFVTDTDANQAAQLVQSCRQLDVGQSARAYRIGGQDGTPYVVVINSTDEKAAVAIPALPNGRLLTPKAATATVKADGNILLTLAPRGCAVLAR